MNKPILKIKNLKVTFNNLQAVEDVSLDVYEGQTLAIVGESGSGKSVTALSCCRLVPTDIHCKIEGSVIYKDQNILKLDPKALRKIRGREISYIFQEPSSSLNPSLSIGYQLSETIKVHFPKSNYKTLSLELLEKVGLLETTRLLKMYPHQLSGGMQQRVMIALALACKPSILIADEPTTALDTFTQANIIDLLKNIQKETQMAIILITHNLGIIPDFAQEIAIMYKGNIVEKGKTESVLKNPKHSYTKGLIDCIPKLNSKIHRLTTLSI